MERLLKDQMRQLAHAAYDDDGAKLTIASPATCTIYDGAGVEVQTGAASVASGSLSYSPNELLYTKLDGYKVVWSGKVNGVARQWTRYFELVGGHLFEIYTLRNYDPAYADTSKYPNDKLQKARVWVEQRIENEQAAAVAFVPRGARESFYGDGTTTARLKWPRIRTIYSVTVDGVALTADELAALRVSGRWVTNESIWTQDELVEIHYEHGYDEAPSPVSEVGLILAREYLVSKSLSSRATAESTDVGFFRLSIAAAGGKTGIPECDAIIADYSERTPVIG